MKSILLKIAHKIYIHYNHSIQVNFDDTIVTQWGVFKPVNCTINQLPNTTTMEITLEDLSSWITNNKYRMESINAKEL